MYNNYSGTFECTSNTYGGTHTIILLLHTCTCTCTCSRNGSIIRVMHIVHVHNNIHVHAKHTQLKKRVDLLDQQREVHEVLR